jgi:hypothetical protein
VRQVCAIQIKLTMLHTTTEVYVHVRLSLVSSYYHAFERLSRCWLRIVVHMQSCTGTARAANMLCINREVVESILLLLRIVCTKTENNKASFMRHGGCKLLIAALHQWADVSAYAYTQLTSTCNCICVQYSALLTLSFAGAHTQMYT